MLEWNGGGDLGFKKMVIKLSFTGGIEVLKGCRRYKTQLPAFKVAMVLLRKSLGSRFL